MKAIIMMIVYTITLITAYELGRRRAMVFIAEALDKIKETQTHIIEKMKAENSTLTKDELYDIIKGEKHNP